MCVCKYFSLWNVFLSRRRIYHSLHRATRASTKYGLNISTDRSRLGIVRSLSSRERPDRLRCRIRFLYPSSDQRSRKSIVTHSRDLTVNLPQKPKAIKSLSLPRRSFNPGAMTYRDEDGLLCEYAYREIGRSYASMHLSIIIGDLS